MKHNFKVGDMVKIKTCYEANNDGTFFRDLGGKITTIKEINSNSYGTIFIEMPCDWNRYSGGSKQPVSYKSVKPYSLLPDYLFRI